MVAKKIIKKIKPRIINIITYSCLKGLSSLSSLKSYLYNFDGAWKISPSIKVPGLALHSTRLSPYRLSVSGIGTLVRFLSSGALQLTSVLTLETIKLSRNSRLSTLYTQFMLRDGYSSLIAWSIKKPFVLRFNG